ncbi:hypothetical protein JTE90_007753 [Oedothorax gibbosus]|uniref:Uncharacterized protein n=1 Tax=Oedothorax gibbosus TaxID=931172 RepID=A0AAV6V8A0_9ARAC|nr:hypothetical protein JTE90_007753 [Oedothorax gibbosus]
MVNTKVFLLLTVVAFSGLSEAVRGPEPLLYRISRQAINPPTEGPVVDTTTSGTYVAITPDTDVATVAPDTKQQGIVEKIYSYFFDNHIELLLQYYAIRLIIQVLIQRYFGSWIGL